MYLRIFLNWLLPPLSSLERKLINELANHLSAPAKALLLAQMKRVNFVQRHVNHKEVNLYFIKNGKVFFDEKIRFPETQSEIKLGSISFDAPAPGVQKSFQVNFWLVRGWLFSMEFNQSPKDARADKVVIKEVKILIDPIAPTRKALEKPIKMSFLTNWLADWAGKWHVSLLKRPLPDAEREMIVKQLDAKLPEDYLELVSQTEGMKINSCLIYGLSEIRDLILPKENYYVLAEISGTGVLAVRKERFDSEIYFLNYEDGHEISLGVSFRLAVEQQLERLKGD